MDGQNQQSDRSGGHTDLRPDEAISPRLHDEIAASQTGGAELPAPQPIAAPPATSVPNAATAAAEPPAGSVESAQAVAATAQAPGSPAVVTAPSPSPAPTPRPATVPAQPATPVADSPQYSDSGLASPQADPAPYDTTTVAPKSHDVSWTASEFIAHHKSPTWYATLAVVSLVVAIIIYLITRDMFIAIVVLLCAVLFGMAASRQPRQLEYAVDKSGVHVGPRSFPYAHFRSFAVVRDGAFSNISFMPLKRFSPPLSIYYDPLQEDEIVEALAGHLPMAEPKRDWVEQLMRRIRF